MKKLFVAIVCLSSMTAFAGEKTILCYMAGPNGKMTELQLTYQAVKISDLLRKSSDTKTPFKIVAKIEEAPAKELSLQAQPFGGEPNMFETQNEPIESNSSLKITYDFWGAPTLAIALTIDNEIYVDQTCGTVSSSF